VEHVASVDISESLLFIRALFRLITMLLFIRLSIEDIRKKSVSAVIVFIVVIMSILSFVLGIIIKNKTGLELGLSPFLITPGLLFLVMEKASCKIMGMADSLLLIAMGLLLCVREYLLGIMIALCLLFLFSIFSLVTKKLRKDSRLAMIPFLSIGMSLGIIITRVEVFT